MGGNIPDLRLELERGHVDNLRFGGDEGGRFRDESSVGEGRIWMRRARIAEAAPQHGVEETVSLPWLLPV